MGALVYINIARSFFLTVDLRHRNLGSSQRHIVRDLRRVGSSWGEFVNFRIRALLLLIQLLECENLTFHSSREPLRQLHVVGGDPV